MTVDSIIMVLIIGAVAGWLAGKLMKGWEFVGSDLRYSLNIYDIVRNNQPDNGLNNSF